MFLRRHSHNHNEDESVMHDAKVNELKAALGPLSSERYCTDSSLRRHLVARSWNVIKAKKMVEETLKWRSTYKPDKIRWVYTFNESESLIYAFYYHHEVASEGETGKLYRANFHDRQGRTVFISRPAMQKTVGVAEEQIRHLVYLTENAILNLPEGQEQTAWLIDFTGWTLKNRSPIKTTRDILNIVQSHYPERLGVAFMYNAPKIFEAFWMIVKRFLDQKTSEKLKFVYPGDKESVELMSSYFDSENLPTDFGGKANLQYDHDEFSKLMEQDELKFYNEQRSHEKTVHVNDTN